ncbi:MAG: LysM peptidoglycan-binding domain-containing protein [Pirellulaceae bacterium]
MAKKRVLLGLSIIAGGVCASLPFLRETPRAFSTSPNLASSPSPASVLPLLDPSAAKVVSAPPAATESPPTGPSPYIDDGSQRLEGELPSRLTATSSIEEVSALPKDKSNAPPLLPVSFQVKQPEESAERWEPAKLAEGPAGPPREYKIRRTDTLEDLALRLLGSQDRAEELFEANRSVLKDRHILPLGAVIRIPGGGVESPSEAPETDLQPVSQPGD